MTSTQGWIKMSARKPSRSDLPFWVNNPAGVWLWEADTEDFDIAQLGHPGATATHWQPATPPEPPKEKAQWMQDLEARDEAWTTAEKVCRSNGGGWFSEGWNMALAYRDKQNAEDIEALHGRMLGHVSTPYASLRRRCGLDT